MYEGGGGIYIAKGRNVLLERTEFRENYGGIGGGMMVKGSTFLDCVECTFNHNTVAGSGGGVAMDGNGMVSLVKSIFSCVCG